MRISNSCDIADLIWDAHGHLIADKDEFELLFLRSDAITAIRALHTWTCPIKVAAASVFIRRLIPLAIKEGHNCLMSEEDRQLVFIVATDRVDSILLFHDEDDIPAFSQGEFSPN
jgi:hypothetical protein